MEKLRICLGELYIQLLVGTYFAHLQHVLLIFLLHLFKLIELVVPCVTKPIQCLYIQICS